MQTKSESGYFSGSRVELHKRSHVGEFQSTPQVLKKKIFIWVFLLDCLDAGQNLKSLSENSPGKPNIEPDFNYSQLKRNKWSILKTYQVAYSIPTYLTFSCQERSLPWDLVSEAGWQVEPTGVGHYSAPSWTLAVCHPATDSTVGIFVSASSDVDIKYP